MRRFFQRNDVSDLESELRAGRPEPRPELLDSLLSSIGSEPAPRPVTRRPRVAAALAFAVLVLVAFGAFGGIGYAKSSFVSAAKSSEKAVSAVVTRGGSTKATKANTASQSTNRNRAENGNAGNNGNANTSRNGNGNGPGRGEDGNDDEGEEDDDDDPWVHQYSRFVLVCYPFQIGNRTIYRTIIWPRRFVDLVVPPGTLGRCQLGPPNGGPPGGEDDRDN